ncbi:hypothetical protein CR513_43248, partial [Mucuna pruriens]
MACSQPKWHVLVNDLPFSECLPGMAIIFHLPSSNIASSQKNIWCSQILKAWDLAQFKYYKIAIMNKSQLVDLKLKTDGEVVSAMH